MTCHCSGSNPKSSSNQIDVPWQRTKNICNFEICPGSSERSHWKTSDSSLARLFPPIYTPAKPTAKAPAKKKRWEREMIPFRFGVSVSDYYFQGLCLLQGGLGSTEILHPKLCSSPHPQNTAKSLLPVKSNAVKRVFGNMSSGGSEMQATNGPLLGASSQLQSSQ